ncbi:formimidoylglutamase [Sporosarcina koreensis]|uniref:Formimidoylglutamase n=1 Tax=Sporosarcina koreensis TaxID=334735 RepID=A0ABW0U134_9BACL
MSALNKVNESIWTGRTDDTEDRVSFRYHQVVEQLADIEQASGGCAIIGFECEEGVRRNKGRLGAAEAPNALRSGLANLPWRFPETARLSDVGNIACDGEDLESAQQQLGKAVTAILSKGVAPIILGGGHETLYGHYLGVREFIGKDATLGIVNIDAHFDLRPYDEQPSSGTMFRQILEQDPKARYFVAGIQRYGNTQELFDRADLLGVTYVHEDEMIPGHLDDLMAALDDFIGQHDSVMLTLCTDVLNAAFAPGVSAPSPFGLEPSTVRAIIRKVAGHERTRSFDICEVNPTLDEGGRTVKLGAYFVNEAIVSLMNK